MPRVRICAGGTRQRVSLPRSLNVWVCDINVGFHEALSAQKSSKRPE